MVYYKIRGGRKLYGEVKISNIGFIERGYHDLTGKLAALGAEISREAEERDTEEDH